jgi:superfamily II DNA or RNA helicase
MFSIYIDTPMEVINFKMKDHAMLQITDAEPGVISQLNDYFTFEVPGAKFMPAVKARRWDGKIRMLNRTNGEINVGLYWAIKKFCMERGYGVKVEDGPYGVPYEINKLNHMKTLSWVGTLGLPFAPRDYQYDAMCHAIKFKRSILISPTGSGKSLIIYMLMRWYMENHDKKLLVIVPTTSLVEQMWADFEAYGFNVEKNCHKIYSGKDKETDKRVIITTWQSIYKLHPVWFKEFGCIFGDEVHGFKSKSLSSIMNKAYNAEYRFGTTGTLDGTQVHKLVLEGLFGPVHRVTTTATLQEKKQLASLDIDIILLKHSKENREKLIGATYQEEIDFIVSHAGRNRFISNLALSLTGNTLVLFNLVDKHGKVLRDLVEDKIDEGRKLFYVSGETKTSDREAIRNIVETQTDSIVIASLGTFSTGINIKNIHNIVFASPSKSQIRVLQSIGRGLRLSDDGRTTKLYDIADDLRSGKPNFTLLHSAERVKIYNRELFKHKISEVVI